MLHLSCYWTFVLYFVCVVPLFLILQNLFLYLTLNMLICSLYLEELQATCPYCILNTAILSNLKLGVFLIKFHVFISKKVWQILTVLHSLPQQFQNNIFKHIHTYVYVVTPHVNRKTYG